MIKKVFNESEVPGLNVPVDVRLKGRYRMVAGKADGSGERFLAEFDNMVLDQGLDYLFTAASTPAAAYDRFLVVGAGISPEHESQTSLDARIATYDISGSSGTVNRTVNVLGGSPFRISVSRWGRFPEGAAAGIISEVGIGWSASTLFSRALVRDVNGDPTSVEVLPDEYLHLTYTLDVYIDVTDKPFTLNFPHGVHDCILRPADLNADRIPISLLQGAPFGKPSTNTNHIVGSIVSNQPLADVTNRPGSSTSNRWGAPPTASSPVPYEPGSFTDTVKLTYPPSVANISGGIRTLVVAYNSWISYQMSFEPRIPKTSDDVFTLTLRITLGRA